MKYPFGECECSKKCLCRFGAGPAIYQVKRKGMVLKVCSRCDLSSDTEKVQLGDHISLSYEEKRIFIDWDPLFMFNI